MLFMMFVSVRGKFGIIFFDCIIIVVRIMVFIGYV